MSIYADRPWLKHYDSHVPHSLEPYPDIPVHNFLRDVAKKQPNNPALVTTVKLPLFGRRDSVVNYGKLDELSDTFGAALQAMGLQKGDKVAIVMPNCVAFAIAYWGILKAGGVVAATNPTYPPKKLEYQLNDCDAEIVVCLTLFYDLVKRVQPNTKVKKVIATNIKEYFPPLGRTLFTLAMEKKAGHRVEALQENDVWFQDVLQEHAGKTPQVDVSGADLALFQYTGGTTGVSKGAMATHKNLVANVLQLQAWTNLTEGIDDIAAGDLVHLGALPMFHSFGLIAMLTQANATGSQIVLVPNARDVDEVIDIIGHYRPNVFLGVPALYNAINNHPRVTSGEVSLNSFMLNVSGSAPLPAATKHEYERLSGSVIIEGFGMSETPVATHGNPLKGQHKLNSVGLPYPDIDVRVVSLNDGVTEVGVGEVGELLLAGPNIMQGYYNMPKETENTLREKDGKTWLHSGDIVKMDEDGYFYIVDRKKDMALIGGFNVYPASIERALKDHPAVFEVGVAAIPHPEKQGQEALKAWIVLQPDQQVTEEELVQHCQEYLAQYEIPRRFEFIDEIPKSTVGKTLRRELVRIEREKREQLSET